MVVCQMKSLRTPGVDDYNVVDFNNMSFMPSSAKIEVT
jgi:hypothetical protein